MQYFLTDQPKSANLSFNYAASAYQPFATGEFDVGD